MTATANALAETVNGYYKAELIRGPARTEPWRTVEEVELATLGWVHWHNTQRLHGYLGDIPPVEFEALHAAQDDQTASTAPNSGDRSVTDGTVRPADRLPAPLTEPLESSKESNAAPQQPARPPAPPGSVTIMCGNPATGIQRTPRRPKRAR